MMELDSQDYERLSHVFDNTTATYKFYWMLSLLDVVRQGRAHQPISYAEMVARMVGKAWQPLMSGNFSFGKCDSLIDRVKELIAHSPLCISSYEERVYYYMMANKDTDLVKEMVKKLTKYVPTRFLYPWIGTCTDSVAYKLSSKLENRCLYSLDGSFVYVNPLWITYLLDHNYLLEGFTYHHLNCFLEKRNVDFVLPIEASLVSTADGMRMSYSDMYKRHFCKSTDKQTNQKKRSIKHVYNIYAEHIGMVKQQISNYGPSTQIDNHNGGTVTNK